METFQVDDTKLLFAEDKKKSPRCCACCHDLLDRWNRSAGLCDCLSKSCKRQKVYSPRFLTLGKPPLVQKFPSNAICNQKYNIFTFIPLVLFEQFSIFLNLMFLVMACSQLIPSLRIGPLYTYWGPLCFVILITMLREAVDDIRRWKRDREVNATQYTKLLRTGRVSVSSAKIQVGDLIIVEKDQRVPADLILLRTTEKSGSCFIRTDQLDGETDWKLRLAVPSLQALGHDDELFKAQGQVYAEPPKMDIHNFEGSYYRIDGSCEDGVEPVGAAGDPLSIENTLWANTVLANGEAVGLVIYTGSETRAVMNSSQPRSKLGIIDLEINNLTKLLVVSVVVLSIVMLGLKGFTSTWYKHLWRYFLLFSYIIPLALRVNLDLSKIVCAFVIMRDKAVPGNIVRNTTIPEELGRISYLLSDKTGTLTQNEMLFRKLHLGTVSFGTDSMDEVVQHVSQFYGGTTGTAGGSKLRSSVTERVTDAVRAIALCHNVTPMMDDDATEDDEGVATTWEERRTRNPIQYQASSPDEVCLVSWTETVGLTLIKRDLNFMELRTPAGDVLSYDILQVFPFTSETKRMGIIVRERHSGQVVFYMKGADVVMSQIVTYTDWLDEETGNMAREGLRTLVVGKKVMTEEQYRDFETRYHQAKISMQDRQSKVSATIVTLEKDLELLCLTGVEDKLQEEVRPTLETLRNADIRVWMLTGDKLETAESIAKSSRLVSRSQTLHVFRSVQGRAEAHLELNAFRKHPDCALIITGSSLDVCLQHYEHEFVELACQCPAVIVCRCSPTQKATIVELVKRHTQQRCAAIGDGGNDVSMIQAADVGIGIVGKEGRQASLASDFSITQFKHVANLMLVHGRRCYRNTASLSQFIIHRGTIICVMQAIFSAVFSFVSIPLFPSFLMVGYVTVFTMFPVFSLILDEDVSESVALRYPELYKDLKKGRELTFKTFFVWVLISVYQGGIIMYGALLLFEDDFIHVVAITFTALILTELLMVALTIHTWHILMVVAEFFSLSLYILALVVLKNYFDPEFLKTLGFVWRVAAITAISCIPLIILKVIRFKLRPPVYSKLQE